MTVRLRFAVLHLALVAMMLRALLPAGWMLNPAGAGHSLFVICTADGPSWPATDHHQGKQTPDDGQHNHDECPFGAAPHFAPPATFAQISLPPLVGRFFNPPGAVIAVPFSATYQPQSPRAPPLLA